MTFNDYQTQSKIYDLFPNAPEANLSSPAFLEKVLGLSGEAGETADKIKKILRDQNGLATDQDKAEIKKELGDVLWYLANISRYLNIPLDDVAQANLKKLNSRKQRNLLHGSGDNR